MNIAQFFEHWRIIENPFRGEEARHDSVFARVGFGELYARRSTVLPPEQATPPEAGAEPAVSLNGPAPAPAIPAHLPATAHSDFEKILGDMSRPATSIVFGEKGSGKTAIRLQIADRLYAHNSEHPDAKMLLIAYDDLNAILDRYYRKVGGKTPGDALARFRLVDHIDAILGLVIPRLVDTLIRRPPKIGAPRPAEEDQGNPLDLGPEPRKLARRLDGPSKRDLLLLQAVYDRPETADARTAALRRVLRVGLPGKVLLWNGLAWLGWIPAAALVAYLIMQKVGFTVQSSWGYAFLILLGLWLLALAKRYGWDNLALIGIARRVRRQLRTIPRSDVSLVRSLRQLDPASREGGQLPLTDLDEARYSMLERLRRVLRQFGYSGLLIVIDRVDEPTLISGDPERMRAFIWPMFNNKFLQQQGVGIKMLLPIELRHALFKESSAFFQEARLDKQNLVERLTWTGAMLYDLCDARLKACRDGSAGPIALMDLFSEEVTARDLIDALDQMHQPRDAFKFLYRCIGEHCSNVTVEQQQWRIPRLVLESVRKQESDRVQQLYRGIRPA
jgi:hypothetical protein